MIHILEHVSLKLYSTMRLGGTARFVCTVTSEDEVVEALSYAQKHSLPYRMIGKGSNIVWRESGFDGLLIINEIDHFNILEDGVSVEIGAGMVWDDAVAEAVEHELCGIECLSLIPGTSGATPVQNVGAYGCEIKDVLTSLRAYDTKKHEFVTLAGGDCDFGYRSSRFKGKDAGRFLITSITLKLSHDAPQPPFYESLQSYLDENHQTEITVQAVRDAVIAIRSSKLPDPAHIANNGSFFANPIIPKKQYAELLERFPDTKGWPYGDGVKLAAGWLVDKAGFRDYHDKETGMATWKQQNLVLVNESARSTDDLLKFTQKIKDAVHEKFGVTLEQEPELLP